MNRVVKISCAVISVAFGMLMLGGSTASLIIGAGPPMTNILGIAWGVAVIVCGVETFRGPLTQLAKANDADLARELEQ